jgi:hypothetical protein
MGGDAEAAPSRLGAIERDRPRPGKLSNQITALSEAIDPDTGAVTVAVFAGETPEFASRRHRELRPEHAGRRVRFDYRPNKRDEWHEWGDVHIGATEADFRAFQAELSAMWDSARASRSDFVNFYDEEAA